MSRYDVPAVVEDIVWAMKLGDYTRSLNRADINNLFNGAPPYSTTNAEQTNLSVNTNFLDGPKLAHDARRQFYNAFLKPGQYFSITEVDRGPQHRRSMYAKTITNRINRKMKQSLPYYETRRSEFASLVLHGIGPSVWCDREFWRPRAVGVEDVLMPGGTLVSMENLPFFAVFRSFSAAQLRRLTAGPNVDPAWNMPLVNELIDRCEMDALNFGVPETDIYNPEKMAERYKEDGGLLSSDRVSTIDCWDFYFWSDEKKDSGWRRRIVLDTNMVNQPSQGGIGVSPASYDSRAAKSKYGTRDKFLYNPGTRKYADKLSEIISIQFSDLSAVAPFRYHSVRSLGFLLYSVCHVQNRLMCKFMDSTFEQLMQYFRVASMDDVERVLKIELFDKGFVDESVKFIPQGERWQVNAQLAEMCIALNRQTIGTHASSFTQDYDFGKEQAQKTATEVMAQVHSTTALVSAALSQAYEYAKYQYYEIARRFSIRNSRDGDVRKFRAECMRDGVPVECLDSECWDIAPEQVMGGGNKMLEMTILDKLMGIRNLFDPEPQRMILRDYTLGLTDDPGRAKSLVPEQPVKVTDSVHDAQLVAGSLMQGFQVGIKTGMNHIEYVDTLLAEMAMVIQRINQSGGMASPKDITGLTNMAQHISQHIAIIAQDKNEKQRVKKYGDAIGQLMNFVNAYQQRLQQAMQKQAQQGNGQQNAELQAKLQAQNAQAQAKIQQGAQSHAARTAQRQAQFEMGLQQDAERHQLQMRMDADKNQRDLEKAMIKDVEETTRSKAKAIQDAAKAAAVKKQSTSRRK